MSRQQRWLRAAIGPGPLFRQSDRSGPPRGASLLEFGGTVIARDSRGRRRRLRYRRRPFMGPALEKVKPKLPELWANSVK